MDYTVDTMLVNTLQDFEKPNATDADTIYRLWIIPALKELSARRG